MAEEQETKKFKSTIKNLSKNYWAVATIVLAVLLVLSIALNQEPKVNPTIAGNAVVDFAKSQGMDAELISVTEEQGLYFVTLNIDEQEVSVYTTKDGKNMISSLYPLTSTTNTNTNTNTQEEVPQKEIPTAELFIWSYCPYGVTALAPFSEVAKLLGDSANFKVYLYYAGHGDFEVQQNKIQACIQDLGFDYWDYAETFANEIYTKCSGDADCDLEESVKLMKSLGINSDAVLSCVETKGEALLEEHYNKAKDAGVSGSPSLVVNGVLVSVSRTAEAYKQAVCSAFTTAPTTCEETLSSTSGTSSGSC